MATQNTEKPDNQPHRDIKQIEKSTYVRPALVKHGNVESLTLTQIDPSGPIKYG